MKKSVMILIIILVILLFVLLNFNFPYLFNNSNNLIKNNNLNHLIKNVEVTNKVEEPFTNTFETTDTTINSFMQNINKLQKYVYPSNAELKSELNNIVDQISNNKIDISKKKLDEKYYKDRKAKLDELINDTLSEDNKLIHINSDYMLLKENIEENNFKIKFDDNENKCLNYNNNNLVKINCDNVAATKFNKIDINSINDYNKYLHENYDLKKKKNIDTLNYNYSILKIDDNDDNTKNNKCLSIKNKTLFIDDCNGSTNQQFYQSR